MPTANFAGIRRRLLSWYETHKRDLPWRRTSDPYAIWISETMLQQTQVATVVPYFSRFMQALPDVEALNRAPLAKVLALWSGLGYYRRAENLKKAARILAARHCGNLPDDYEKLRALPGVGEYTAGAVLSIAFGKAQPAVDANVRRVLSRLFLTGDEKQLRDKARKLVAYPRPGQLNQSLMELGSVLCTPKIPRCANCPLGKICPAYGDGMRQLVPVPGKRPRSRSVIWPLAIVRWHGKLLLRRRGANGILAGLWEFPGGEHPNRRAAQSMLTAELAGIIATGAKLRCVGEIVHAITNRRIRAPVFLIELAPVAKIHLQGARWVGLAALDGYPTSSMTRKALKVLADYEKSHP